MEIMRKPPDDLDARAAELVSLAVRDAVETRQRAVVGLVGGRSVGGLYRRLTTEDLPWDRVELYMADERVVPVTSGDSNWRIVGEGLVDPLVESGRLPAANAHPFRIDPAAPDHGLGTYTATFAAAGGGFDIVILSAGEDGHCASLFPNHASVRDDGDGYLLVANSPKPPPLRISASRRLLARAPCGVVYFLGEGKRAALDLFLDPNVDVYACPSKVVESMRESLVLTDL
ncbi:MAG: 6-phosphogluconolactonase [Acidimicrobiia bacterium]|nr:6-phosphogluconolactonase [Acidimicrobiia bacterium]